jgi:Fe-S-cluster containining protein
MSDIKIKQDDGRVFIDMADNQDNPCLNCGLCCNHFRISFYCGELDTQPMGFVPNEMTSKINDFFACMKGTETGGRCTALIGTPGQEGIKCSIYSNRPSPCREYEVWDDNGIPNPKCNELRAKAGISLIQEKEMIES